MAKAFFNSATQKTKQCLAFALAYFFLVLSAPAQTFKIDSLQELLNHQQLDTQRIHQLNELSWEMYNGGQMDCLVDLAKEAFQLSEELNFLAGKAQALNLLAISYDFEGKLDQSIAMNLQALAIAQSINDSEIISAAHNDLGLVYSIKGDPKNALQHYQQAVDIALLIKDTTGICVGLSNIGMLHYYSGKKEGIDYLKQSAAIAQQSNEAELQLNAALDLGLVYAAEKELEAAFTEYQLAKTIADSLQDKVSLVTIHYSLGEYYRDCEAEDQAIKHFQHTIDLTKESGDEHSYVSYLSLLADYYGSRNDCENAMPLAEQALALIGNYEQVNPLREHFKPFSRLYAQKKDYQKAYELSKEYLAYIEEEYAQNKHQQLEELEKKYQFEKKEAENLLLKTQQNKDQAIIRQQRWLNGAFGFILLLSILLLAVFILALGEKEKSHKLLESRVIQRTKDLEKSNRELKRSLKEQERFAYVASHDLKEPLRNISSFASLLERQLRLAPTSREGEYMTFIIRNAKQMHSLIENLQEFSNLNTFSQEDIVDLDAIVEQWKQDWVAKVFPNDAVRLMKKSKLPCISGSAKHFNLLFKNLIENAVNYNEEALKIVEFEFEQKEDHLLFRVRDNGIGIERDYFQKIFELFKRLHHRGEYDGSGLGLAICQKIIESRGGEIWVDSTKGEGSCFYFSLPLNCLITSTSFQPSSSFTKSKSESEN